MVVDTTNSANLRTLSKNDTPSSRREASRAFATPGSTAMRNVNRTERSPWPTRSRAADTQQRNLNNPSPSHALDKQRVLELSFRLRQSHGKLAEATSALEAAVAEVRRLHKENEVLHCQQFTREVSANFANMLILSQDLRSHQARQLDEQINAALVNGVLPFAQQELDDATANTTQPQDEDDGAPLKDELLQQIESLKSNEQALVDRLLAVTSKATAERERLSAKARMLQDAVTESAQCLSSLETKSGGCWSCLMRNIKRTMIVVMMS